MRYGIWPCIRPTSAIRVLDMIRVFHVFARPSDSSWGEMIMPEETKWIPDPEIGPTVTAKGEELPFTNGERPNIRFFSRICLRILACYVTNSVHVVARKCI